MGRRSRRGAGRRAYLLADSPLELAQQSYSDSIVSRWYRPDPDPDEQEARRFWPPREEPTMTITQLPTTQEAPAMGTPPSEHATWQGAVLALEEMLYSYAESHAVEVRELKQRVEELERGSSGSKSSVEHALEEKRKDDEVVALLTRIGGVKLAAPEIADELGWTDARRDAMLSRLRRLVTEGRVVMVPPPGAAEKKRQYRKFHIPVVEEG